MEETFSIYFFRALIVLGIFALTNGQFGLYGRRRIIPRRMYPRYPMGGGLIDPYSRRSIIGDPYVDPYIGTDTFGGGIYPGGGIGVIGGRRPVVVDDSSRRNAQDINVSNNNVNREVRTDSNNVVVNQVTNTRTCECQTGHIMGGQCGPYQQCVSDSSCSGGGGNGVCRDTGIGGGFMDGPFVGGPVVGGPVVGGPIMGGPGGFVDGHGHGHGGMRIV